MPIPNRQKASYWIGMSGLCCSLWGCTASGSHPANHYQPVAAAKQYNAAQIARAKQLAHDGDLVLRTGNDFISNTLRQFSTRDQTYSHCGLIQVEAGRVYVYHAIGGEDNPNAKLRKDPFETFCDPASNKGFGIFRYNLTNHMLRKLDSVVHHYYLRQVKFDLQFDLKSDEKLYCAEFVYKTLLAATGNVHYLSSTKWRQFEYIAIDDLFLNPHNKEIFHARFQ